MMFYRCSTKKNITPVVSCRLFQEGFDTILFIVVLSSFNAFNIYLTTLMMNIPNSLVTLQIQIFNYAKIFPLLYFCHPFILM
jgi:hypothetical protein